jgi:hypothetical protein
MGRDELSGLERRGHSHVQTRLADSHYADGLMNSRAELANGGTKSHLNVRYGRLLCNVPEDCVCAILPVP